MMKNLSLILNGVLLAAVIVLYVLFFANKKSGTASKDTEIQSQNFAQGDIVYINIDTVLSSYKMYIDLQYELEGKKKTSEEQLANQGRNLQKEVEDFQYKVGKQLVTRSEADEIQQKLAQKEQDFYQLQGNLQAKLAEEQQVAQNKVISSIMDYLQSLEGKKNYKFVLGTSFGGGVLYANKNLNITKEVIIGLNEKYTAEKEK